MTSALAIAALTGSSLALISAAHCAVMCGPLALGARVRSGPRIALSYFGGRFVSYTLLGALAGSAGRVLALSPWARWSEAVLSWLLALSLLRSAYEMFGGRARRPLLRLGTGPRVEWFGRALARVAHDPLLLGAATALLPCGALYSALTAAAALGNAVHGALAMGTFALLTGASLIGVAKLSGLAQTSLWRRRALGAALLIGAGVMLYRPVPLLRAQAGVPACHAVRPSVDASHHLAAAHERALGQAVRK